jgi:hypothetical protein
MGEDSFEDIKSSYQLIGKLEELNKTKEKHIINLKSLSSQLRDDPCNETTHQKIEQLKIEFEQMEKNLESIEKKENTILQKYTERTKQQVQKEVEQVRNHYFNLHAKQHPSLETLANQNEKKTFTSQQPNDLKKRSKL